MIKIIITVFLYVFLLIMCSRSRKTNRIPLKMLPLIPGIFMIWSLFSFFDKFTDWIAIFLWIASLSVGSLIGFFHIHKQSLRFDKTKNLVEIPGSWFPLTLALCIIVSKCSVGILKLNRPHLEGSLLFWGFDLFAVIVLGIFVGRAINCFHRYRSPYAEVIEDQQLPPDNRS